MLYTFYLSGIIAAVYFGNTSGFAEMRSYAKVNFVDHNFLSELQVLFPMDKASMHILLGVYDPECKDQFIKNPSFTAANRHAGGEVLAVRTLPKSEFPIKVDECAVAFYYTMHAPLEEPSSKLTDMDKIALNAWLHQRTSLSMVFTNGFDFPIEFFWQDEAIDNTLQGRIEPGESMQLTTRLGHLFFATTIPSDAKNAVVDYMIITGDDEYVFQASNRMETCELYYHDEISFTEGHVACDDMDARLIEFAHASYHDKRIALNYFQPQIVRPVTADGFRLIKLPTETYSWLREWYMDAQREMIEDEGSSGSCMNQAVAPSSVTHITPTEKKRLAVELKPILEGWYGGELFMTSIYGIRKYTNGSVLRMHVDTLDTHVVSCIINVDQQSDEPWPLLILDHEGNEHNVTMAAGEMVLYESAKLLHGRPTPFIGSHYDNIFAHYKPISGWDYSWV